MGSSYMQRLRRLSHAQPHLLVSPSAGYGQVTSPVLVMEQSERLHVQGGQPMFLCFNYKPRCGLRQAQP